MPIHDWTRVSPNTFHDFHCSWITHLKETLNEECLPRPYHATSEQFCSDVRPDVLTLKMDDLKKETDPSKIIYVQPGDVIEVEDKVF